MKYRRGPLALLGRTLVHHPARIPEALLAVLLPALLLIVGRSHGGEIDEGLGLLRAVPLCFLMAGLGAFWWTLKGQGVELSKGVLWTVPLVAYLGVHAFFLSDAPWRSVPFFGAVFMAWLAYATVAQMMRQRALLYLLSGLSLLVVLGLGLEMFFFDPPVSGLETLEGEVVVVELADATFGYFQQAPAMVFGWLLTLPFALVGLILPRLPGYIRIALGGYVLLGTYQVCIAGNEAAYLAAGLGLLVLPFFVSSRWSARFKVSGITVGVLVFWMLLFSLHPGLSGKFEAARALQPGLLESTRWTAALEVWQGAPVTGIGAGVLDLAAETLRVEPAGTDLLGARQTALQVLAETGIVGLLLVLLAVGGTLGRLLVAWGREPFYPLDKEAEFRHAAGRGESRRGRSSRRRREHRLKRSTTRKVFFGGIVLGLLCVLVFAQFESSWLIGFPLLLLGTWAGVGERILAEGDGAVRVAGRSGPVRFAFAGLFCGLAGVCLLLLDPYRAAMEAYEAETQLAPYRDRAALAFESPTGVMEARRAATYALKANPAHAEAWALVAGTYVLEEAIARIPLEEAGRRAEEAAEAAIALYPESGTFHLNRALGLALRGAEASVTEAAFKRAADLAPNHSETLYQWARYRYLDLGDSDGARELLEQLLAGNPDNEEATNLMRRLEL